MGDSYRPHRRRSRSPSPHRGGYFDSDNADGARVVGRRDRYGDSYSRDERRVRSSRNHLDYDDGPTTEVQYPHGSDFTRSDILRYELEQTRLSGKPAANGDNDVNKDRMPLRLILVQGLKASTDEKLFAKGMEKFYVGWDDVPGGATPKSLRRVFIIRSRMSDQSMGFAFVEYHSVKEAEAAVDKETELRRADKCTIASAKIRVSFPHLGVFPQVMSLSKPVYDDKFQFEWGSSQQLHTYHDDRYYASEYFVNKEPPRAAVILAKNDSDAEQKKPKTGSKRGIDAVEGKQKKMKVLEGAAAPAYLQHWQNKAAELRGEMEQPGQDAQQPPATGVNTILATTPATESTSEEQTFGYESKSVIGCYLCLSTFTQMEGLTRHLRDSQQHASYLMDEKLVARGYERLRQAGGDPEKTIKLPNPARAIPAVQSAAEDPANKYRDRAAERRQETVQQGAAQKIKLSLKGNDKPKTSGQISGSSSDHEPSKPSYGKGMDMLKGLGWSEGASLGAGDGVTAPIEQNLYASGVGLGHEASKKGDAVEEAGRLTRNDQNEFLEKTKESSRKRYEESK